MNDLLALERSSNSYMFKIALLLNGTPYSYGMPLRLRTIRSQKCVIIMRNLV